MTGPLQSAIFRADSLLDAALIDLDGTFLLQLAIFFALFGVLQSIAMYNPDDPTYTAQGVFRWDQYSDLLASAHDAQIFGVPLYGTFMNADETPNPTATRILAAETRGFNILVNSVCPGWVRTDMGGPNAERTVEQGASGIVWAATLPDDGPSGGFFRDGQPIPW